MARSRNIKPGIFKNELLGVADPLLTILFAGLWCLADRRGRLEDRPLRIKAEIFPYRELQGFNGYLTDLARLGFIRRYTVDGIDLIDIPAFEKHQHPHHTEKESELPEYQGNSDRCDLTVKTPLPNLVSTDTLRLIPDSLNTDSLIPDSVANATRSRFVKPSIEDLLIEFEGKVQSPISEANKFLNHYESNGWKVGRNAMKSWKGAAANWITRAPPPINSDSVSQEFLDRHADTSWAE